MKEFFDNQPERKFFLLVGVFLLVAGLLTYESRRYLRLQEQIAATTVAIKQAREKEATLLAKLETTAEKRSLLVQYEKRIPIADSGYVLVSRTVRGAVPDLTLKISPPEFDGKQLPLSPDYCCGTFAVSGSGQLDQLLQILQRIENDLPFARIQDLHFSFVEDRVNFSFSLMTIMRLNEGLES